MVEVAEVFPPSEFINEELHARKWGITTLMDAADLPWLTCRNLLNGDCKVTPFIAERLFRALGAPADYWLNLQSAYDAGRLSSRATSQYPANTPDAP